MKNKAWTLVLLLTLALSVSHAAQTQELVIDNFISHRETRESLVNGRVVFRRTGNTTNIVGGVRLTDFEAAPLAGGVARSTVLEIPRTDPDNPHNGRMFLESGVKSTFRVVHFYGEDKHGNANPLNLQLMARGFDRFRIEFDSCDVELNYLIEVFDGDGHLATLNGSTSTADKVLPFNVDFLFAHFVPGAPPPYSVNWNDIDAIIVLFQTGNATGSADFVVRRVVALPPQ